MDPIITIEEYRQYVENAQTEAQFQRVVRDFAAIFGWRTQYHTLHAKGSDAGFPDLVLIHDEADICLFVELKRNTGRVKTEQEHWGAQLARVEGASLGALRYRLWRPRDWPLIVADLVDPLGEQARRHRQDRLGVAHIGGEEVDV